MLIEIEELGFYLRQLKTRMTINRSIILSVVIFCILCSICSATAQPAQDPVKKDRKTDSKVRKIRKYEKGSLAENLSLLNSYMWNYWGPQTEAIQSLYSVAYKVLVSKHEATFMDVANDTEVQRICKENGIVHLGGPMLGAVTSEGARVWLRTVQPAKVEVLVTIDGAEKTFGPVASAPETDLTAVVLVTGLKPTTTYPYRVLVDGKDIKRIFDGAIAGAKFHNEVPRHAVITTAPSDDQAGKVRIVFGADYHRRGIENNALAVLMRSRGPAAFLTIGDIAVQDRRNHLGLHRADYLLRDFQTAWQNLVASIPVYATWDDHDYFANDLSGIPEGYTKKDQEGVWDVFRHAWNNPSYGFGDDRRGVFLRTRIGPCDVIMTDERYFRTGKENMGKPNSYLGEAQMRWLEAQLLDCKGPFIILSNGTMWSDYISDGKDSWGKWDPQGRERIFSLIEKYRIGGVLLISGDRHGSRVFRIPRPSGYNFYEFEVGSLGAREGHRLRDNQLCEFSETSAFGEFTIDATVPDPEVTFRLISDDGFVVYKSKLTLSQLTPRGN